MSLFATETDATTSTEDYLYSWSTFDAQTTIKQPLATQSPILQNDGSPGSSTASGTESSSVTYDVTSPPLSTSSLLPSELHWDSSLSSQSTSGWVFSTYSTVSSTPSFLFSTITTTEYSSAIANSTSPFADSFGVSPGSVGGDGETAEMTSDWLDVVGICLKGFIFCTIILGAVLGNALVIISVRRNRKLR